MLKFHYLLKLKTMMSLVVLIHYGLWCIFFILQGQAIELAISKTQVPKHIVYTLVGFVFIKMLVMLCDVLQKYMSEYYKNLEMKDAWHQYMPKRIYKDYTSHKNDIGLLFFEYLPRLFDYEVTITKNKVAIYYIFVLAMVSFIYTDFYWGILAFMIIFSLNYASKNIFTKQIDHCQKESDAGKIKTLLWIDQYLAAYREISKNWPGVINSTWYQSIYNHYCNAKNKQVTFYLYRDILSQILVELPFLLNASFVIMGVYYGLLTLTQLFIWLGFSQFMINASNFYLDNKVAQQQKQSMIEKIERILSLIQTRESKVEQSNSIENGLVAELKLRDGSKNILSLTPGIYHIKGKNGSGKSMLLNIILDYVHEYEEFENYNLSKLMHTIHQDHTRVIERDVTLFDSLDSINAQICGPVNSIYLTWDVQVEWAVKRLLSSPLSNAWMDIFTSLVSEYESRIHKSLSSGEKVILSMLRFFSAWNTDVNLLIVDECDSFLDTKTKNLFIQTIYSLSNHMAVYICSHDEAGFNNSNGESFLLQAS